MPEFDSVTVQEEIGLLRMCVEERLKRLRTPEQMLEGSASLACVMDCLQQLLYFEVDRIEKEEKDAL